MHRLYSIFKRAVISALTIPPGGGILTISQVTWVNIKKHEEKVPMLKEHIEKGDMLKEHAQTGVNIEK